MSRYFLVLVGFFVVDFSVAQVDKKKHWVDSVFLSLSPTEKIGQLLVTTLTSNASAEDLQSLINLSKDNKIGGLIVAKSGPKRYTHLNNKIQAQSKVPIFFAVDLSKGLPNAFDSTMHFYDSMVLNAVADDSLKKKLKKELDNEITTLGIKAEVNITRKTLAGLNYWEVPEQPTVAKKKNDLQLPASFDLLMTSMNRIDPLIKGLLKKLKKEKLLSAQIDSSVLRLLRQKYDASLHQNKFINPDNLFKRLHSSEALLLKQQLAEAAITVVKNDSSFVPVKTLDDNTFASISIGASMENEFTHYLSKYAWFRHHSIMSGADTIDLSEKLKGKSVVVVALYADPDESLSLFIKKLSKKHRLIICSFLNPASLEKFESIPSLISSYSSESGIPQAAAQVIFGGIAARGKLSNTILDSLTLSLPTSSLNRFSYGLPEAVEMDSQTLERIESIAQEAIGIGATPCVNVLVAKNGKVVYEKSFGTLAYDKKSPATDGTIFDLASITKVSATLQAVMHMQEKGMIDVNKKASVYMPELKGSNKEDFVIKDILTHQAGLWPFLPFWVETVKDSTVWKKYYNKIESDEYPFPVSENMFAAKSMKDSLWQWIIKARVRERPVRTVYDYRYSDMAFYMMQHLAEKLLRMPMEDFLQKNIYRPLGAYTTGFLPLRKFPSTQIAPTEKDTLFRKSLLIGYVHDQGAAMHGGIAGHAGLFSNANDLAKLGQMWLNKGTYGGVQFFKPETLELFTAKQYEYSRRGLGWDKPIVNDYQASPTSIYASAKTFGHTGFTGTSIWVDPEFDLVFVFLSNRVNPDMNNNKILTSNIRPRIQDVVYQSIFEYCKNHNEPLKPNEPKFGLTVKP